MASKVKPEKALALLLHEISDCLLAAGSESGSQQSGVNSLTTRMRTVLDSLLDKCVDGNIGASFLLLSFFLAAVSVALDQLVLLRTPVPLMQ